MTCEAEFRNWRDVIKPAQAALIDCEAAQENALSEFESSAWQCGGEVGVGVLGGFVLGSGPGAAIGGIGGLTACMKGLSTAEKEARSAAACLDKYELLLDGSRDEFNSLIKCIVK